MADTSSAEHAELERAIAAYVASEYGEHAMSTGWVLNVAVVDLVDPGNEESDYLLGYAVNQASHVTIGLIECARMQAGHGWTTGDTDD